jgi:hypothetical protein
VIEEALVLERAGDADGCDDVWGAPDQFLPTVVESDPAVRRPVNAGDQVEDGRLAGTIGPDEPDDLALLDAEGEIMDGPESAEVLRQAFGFEKRQVT